MNKRSGAMGPDDASMTVAQALGKYFAQPFSYTPGRILDDITVLPHDHGSSHPSRESVGHLSLSSIACHARREHCGA